MICQYTTENLDNSLCVYAPVYVSLHILHQGEKEPQC